MQWIIAHEFVYVSLYLHLWVVPYHTESVFGHVICFGHWTVANVMLPVT